MTYLIVIFTDSDPKNIMFYSDVYEADRCYKQLLSTNYLTFKQTYKDKKGKYEFIDEIHGGLMENE